MEKILATFYLLMFKCSFSHCSPNIFQVKNPPKKNAWSTFIFSCDDVSTSGTIPLYSFLLSNLSASLTKISFPSSFLVVARTTGFFVFMRLLRIWAVVSTCFSSVRLGTKLTSNTTKNPSMLTFPSGITLWSNSFSNPEKHGL